VPEEWVSVGRLGKPRGLRGELYATVYSSRAESLQPQRRVTLFTGTGREMGAFTVAGVWEYKGGLVIRFAEAPTIAEAEPLAGCDMRIPLAERPAAPDGEFYVADLVGCLVIDRRTNETLGTVAGWQDAGGPGLLEVRREGKTEPMLVPFARSICVEIDPAGRRVVVELPEGLDNLA
jgi:16S rRNA processing protein RimM